MPDPELNDLEHIKLFKNPRTFNWEIKLRAKQIDTDENKKRLMEFNQWLWDQYNEWFKLPSKKVIRSTASRGQGR